MSAIGYRLTVYDGPLYYTGSTVLIPAAGAIHGDQFKVTTQATGSASGYFPYMRIPRGNNGQFNLENARSSVGTYNVELLDAKISASNNANRWVSAFIGDTNAKLSIVGKKAYIEETVNSGSTWSPFFVGRINQIDLSSPLTLNFEIGDSLEILKQTIFSLPPNVGYVAFKSQLPVGGFTKTISASSNAFISASTALDIANIRWSGPNATDRWIELTSAAVNRGDNFWLKGNGYGIGAAAGNLFGVLNGQNTYRCQISSSAGINYYQVDFVQTPANIKESDVIQPIKTIRVVALPTNDPQYSAISTLATGSYTSNIRIYRTLGDTGEEIEPFYLNTTPYQLIRDICDGKFFAQNANTAKILYNSASLAGLETSNVLPTLLFRIGEQMEAVEFLERYICKPFSIGYTFEAALSGSIPVSQLRFFSTKQPTSLTGVATLDADDIISNVDKGWSTTEPLMYVGGRFYVENKRIINRTTLANNPDMDTNPTTISNYTSIIGLDQVTDASYRVTEIDFNAIRGLDNATFNPTANISNISSVNWARGLAERMMMSIYNRQKAGNPLITFQCVRNANTNSVKVGDFVLVNLDVLPNQATHLRGGTRLYQIMEKTANGLTVDLTLADSGVNETMTAPTLGTVTSPRANTATFDVTTTQSASVEIDYAVTTTSDSAPVESSVNWLFFAKASINTTTQSFTISNIPEGRKIFIRVRAVAPDASDVKLPSSYVVSAGTSLSNITAPSAVSVTNITSRAATVSWTNTNTFYTLQVYLASPAGTPDTPIIELPPESTTYRLTGLQLNSSTSHTVGVRYSDAYKGFSAFTTASFTAAGTAPTLDAPASNVLYISGE